jgi:hypothetical protein
MPKTRTFFWVAVASIGVGGAAFALWRWQQQSGRQTVSPFSSGMRSNPSSGPSAGGAPASAEAPRKRVVATRVHKGSPPPSTRPAPRMPTSSRTSGEESQSSAHTSSAEQQGNAPYSTVMRSRPSEPSAEGTPAPRKPVIAASVHQGAAPPPTTRPHPSVLESSRTGGEESQSSAPTPPEPPAPPAAPDSPADTGTAQGSAAGVSEAETVVEVAPRMEPPTSDPAIVEPPDFASADEQPGALSEPAETTREEQPTAEAAVAASEPAPEEEPAPEGTEEEEQPAQPASKPRSRRRHRSTKPTETE